jgi:hypothetical protein
MEGDAVSQGVYLRDSDPELQDMSDEENLKIHVGLLHAYRLGQGTPVNLATALPERIEAVQSQKASGVAPKGALDRVPYVFTPRNDNVDVHVEGWVCDESNYFRGVPVHIFGSFSPGRAVNWGRDFALDRSNSTSRTQLSRVDVASVCGGDQFHGFNFRLYKSLLIAQVVPNSLRIRAYALDIDKDGVTKGSRRIGTRFIAYQKLAPFWLPLYSF